VLDDRRIGGNGGRSRYEHRGAGSEQCTIRPALSNATLNIRYNIVATEGLFGGDRIGMRVRYTDNGANARVVVRLKEVNLQTGATALRMTFDSNAFPQAAGAQTQFVNTPCSSGSFFDFTANATTLMSRSPRPAPAAPRCWGQ
jgi:hypothetical protein